MAIIQYCPDVPEVRGSHGGSLFSSGRSGPTVRAKPQPVLRRTNRREARRVALTLAAIRWRDVLSDPQRTAWNDLGAATTFTSKTGVEYHPIGRNLYIRTNALRFQYYLAPVDLAPALAVCPTYNMQYLFHDQTQSLVAVAGQAMPATYRCFFDLSNALPPTTFFYENPYASNADASGATVKAVFELASPGAFAPGDRLSIRNRQMAADGSLNAPAYEIFSCKESLMFLYQCQLAAFNMTSGSPDTPLRDGTVGHVPYSGAISVVPVLPFACRLRHMALHIRIRNLVGSPPLIYLKIAKNGAAHDTWFFSDPQAAFTTVYATSTDISDLVFAASDRFGFSLHCNLTGAQTALVERVLFQAYFEPGDFS